MRSKVVFGIGVAIIVITAIFGAKTILNRPDAVKKELAAIQEYVFLDAPEISEENEGKTVVIRGSVTGVENAKDPMHGNVEFNYAVVQRRDYIYRYELEQKSDDDDPDTYKAEWRRDKATMLSGKTRIGEFSLDQAFCEKFPYFQTISGNELNQTKLKNYFHFKRGNITLYATSRVPTYSKSGERYRKSDEHAFTYEAYNSDRQLTIIGVQKGKKLVKGERNKCVYSDPVTVASLEKEVATNTKMMYAGIAIMLILGILLAIRGALPKRK